MAIHYGLTILDIKGIMGIAMPIRSQNLTYAHIGLDATLRKLIDDYRFAARHRNEAEAVRALIQLGLLTAGQLKFAEGVSQIPPGPQFYPTLDSEGNVTGWLFNF